jgi:uncharacterized protein YjdB
VDPSSRQSNHSDCAFLASAATAKQFSKSRRKTAGRSSRNLQQGKAGVLKVSRVALRGLLALTALPAVFASCDQVSNPGDSTLVRLALQPSPSEIDDGTNAQMSVLGVEAGGQQVALPPANFATVWSSSDDNVLRVTSSGSTGTVEAVAPGEATITVEATPLTAVARAASVGTLIVSTRIVSIRVPAELVLLSPNHISGLVNTPLPDSVWIRALDRRGTGVPAVQVAFEVMEGGGSLSQTSVMTDTSGYVRTVWRLGPNAGHNRMRGSTNRPTRHVYVEADATTLVPARINVVAGDGQQGTVGSNLPAPVSVRVTDSQSRPVPGVAVVWSVLTGGGTITPQVAPTDDQGVSAVSWDLGTVVGTQTARAAVGSLTASFTASARAAAPSRLVKLAGDAQSATVNTRLTDSLSVQVVDEYGNPVPGVTVNWSVQSGGGSLSPSANTTGTSGIARAAWTMGGTAGTGGARASVTGVGEVTFSATATNGPPPPPPPPPPANQIVKLSGDAQSAPIATALPDSLAVTVRNSQGQGVAGVTVTWNVTSGGGSVSPATDVTDTNGVARTRWTMGSATGSATLKASAQNAGEVNFTATATSGGGGTGQLTITKVSGDAQTATTSTRLPDSLVVQVKNAQGTGVSGVVVTWSVQSGGGSVSPATFTSNANGIARTAWTLGSNPGAGSVSATAPNATDPVTFTGTANAPAPTVARVAVTPPVDTISALNAQVTLSATAYDSGNQPIPGTRFTWRSLNSTIATVDTMGIVTGRAVGSALIVVAAVCCSDADTASIEVLQRVSSIDVSPPTANVQVGSSTSLAATARDANNSVIPSAPLTWSSSNASVATVTQSGQVNGIAVGTVVIRAAAGSVRDSAIVTVSAASSGALANECASPASSWIWCDDFSQDRLGSYFEYDASGGNFARASGVGVDGTFGMRARFNVGQVGAGSLKLAFGRTPSSYFRPVDNGTSNYRDLYWRVFLRNAPNWTGGGGDKLGRMVIFAGANWAEALIAHVWSGAAGSSGINNLVIDPASGTDTQGNLRTTGYNDFPNLRWLGAVQGTTPLFGGSQIGQWHCVETHVSVNDAGQSNGVFEFWINGTLQARSANLNWVGSYNAYGLNALFLENFWNNGSPQQQERYFDNLVVSTQRIGCGGVTPSGPAPVATVAVTPSPATISAGNSLPLTATLRDASGNVLTGRTVNWSSSNTSIATVSAAGLVTALAVGQVSVTATSEGKSSSATITVTSPSAGAQPILVEDFSTYTSTANMLSDPRNIYMDSEEFQLSRMALDTNVGYGGSGKSLRYDYPVLGAVARDYTISRALDVRSHNLTEVWIEIVVRFSSNFSVNAGVPVGAGLKLFTVHVVPEVGGRFGLHMENGDGGQLNAEGPNDDYAALALHSSVRNGSLFNAQWHVLRYHIRLGSSDFHELWVDGVYQGSKTGATAVSKLDMLHLARNLNQGPLQAQSLWWGKITAWKQNPGW